MRKKRVLILSLIAVMGLTACSKKSEVASVKVTEASTEIPEVTAETLTASVEDTNDSLKGAASIETSEVYEIEKYIMPIGQYTSCTVKKEILNSGENISNHIVEIRAEYRQKQREKRDKLSATIDNSHTKEKEKERAVQDRRDLEDLMKMEEDAEFALAMEGGFYSSFVSINPNKDKADVIIDASTIEGGYKRYLEISEISDNEIRRIETIVVEKTGIEAENITITLLCPLEKKDKKITEESLKVAEIVEQMQLRKKETRDINKDIFLSVINCSNIEEAAKQQAIQDWKELTEKEEKEHAIETLLMAKGYLSPFVSVSSDNVLVMINASNITDEQKAQIEDVVTKKAEVEVENISITLLSPLKKVTEDSLTVKEKITTLRLNRRHIRGEDTEWFISVINEHNIEEEKQHALQELKKLTEIERKENIAETLLLAIGFSDPVVYIDLDEVHVVINAPSITDEEREQIEDIVRRKAKIEEGNIIINKILESAE